jgi:DNA-binding protein YbaB
MSERELASITVDFKNGAGSVTVTLRGPNWAVISTADREWVFAMVDSLKDYAMKTESP